MTRSASNAGSIAGVNWPNPSDFAVALQKPDFAFRDSALKRCSIKTDQNQQPRPWSGMFANVYKATLASGERRAIRVFTSSVPERRDRYEILHKFFQNRRLQSLLEFTYEDRGIRSGGNGKWYPLITMEWVEGDTLFDWVQNQCDRRNAGALNQACGLWVDTIAELSSSNIAHGDLQHGNIMVAENGKLNLKLVDYDCMCVPPLEGRMNLEIGVDPYQHPKRDANTPLSRNLDNFSAIFIFVAMRALAASPDLWRKYVEQSAYDKLLFKREDLDSPGASALMNELRRSPDEDVRRMSRELAELTRAPMDQVPPLDTLLFSWTKVQTLLAGRDFDQAVELVLRSRKKFTDAPPPLPNELQVAKQKVDQRLLLERAVQNGDEAAMKNLYLPQLLDNYPRAQSSVAVARDAAKVMQLLQRLQTRNNWPEFIQLWDANRSLLADRQSAKPFATAVESWRIEREQAWTRFSQIPKALSESADEQLLAAWNESLFAGWNEAEPHRSRVREAEKRLALLKQLAAELAAGAVEQAIERIVGSLPAGYSYRMQSRVEKMQGISRATRQLLGALSDSTSDTAIWNSWEQLLKLGGKDQIDKKHHPRIILAKKRLQILLDLKKIPPGYPIAKAPEFDSRILELWKDSLLRECNDAAPWRKNFEAAARRRVLLAQLGDAIHVKDGPKIVELAAALSGYPLPAAWSEIVRQADADLKIIRTLVDSLEKNEPRRFHEAFDARTIRQYRDLLLPREEQIRQWLAAEILPTEKLGLSMPIGRKAVDRQINSNNAYQIFWTWPNHRFSESCLFALCKQSPTSADDPRTMPALTRIVVDRKRYEEAGGMVPINASPGMQKCHVVVWARVDLGFAEFFSEPLVLGFLE
jgi:serine/threonine protein kinase